MIVKKATQVGNSLIRGRAKEVGNIKSKQAQKVVRDLVDSMRHHGLVGMAAPQIGSNLRICVSEIRLTKFRTDKKKLDPLKIFINPQLLSVSKKMTSDWEGCGSVASANLFAEVKRHENITVQAFDANGEKFELKAKGLLARIIQHEMDHINGIVFTDTADPKTYMSGEEYLKMVEKRLKKNKRITE